MKIEIETKYAIGDVLWTDGFRQGGKERIPIKAIIRTASVTCGTAWHPWIHYQVEVVHDDVETFDWDWVNDRAASYCIATADKYEGRLFRTKKEAQEYIDNDTPF